MDGDRFMRIERIDDNTVKCFLSNEELEAYEIDYKDFVMRSERAKEIVQEIIAQAREEVGYNPSGFAFDLQIMMVPDQGMVLVFSDKTPDLKDGEQLMECLKEMKRILQGPRGADKMLQANAETEGKSMQQSAKIPQKSKQKQVPANKPDYAIFSFSSLREVMKYADILPANLRVDSRLFAMDGLYYLYMNKGRASYQRFSRACVQALEFSALYAAEETALVRLQEHGECIIPEKAVKKLRI